MSFRKPIISPGESGVCDDLVGGAAAYPAAPVTVWGQMFGWNHDYQRRIYQPFILIMQVLALFGLFGFVQAAPELRALLIVGLTIPTALKTMMIAPSWYRHFNNQQFHLAMKLLLVSGATLLVQNPAAGLV